MSFKSGRSAPFKASNLVVPRDRGPVKSSVVGKDRRSVTVTNDEATDRDFVTIDPLLPPIIGRRSGSAYGGEAFEIVIKSVAKISRLLSVRKGNRDPLQPDLRVRIVTMHGAARGVINFHGDNRALFHVWIIGTKITMDSTTDKDRRPSN